MKAPSAFFCAVMAFACFLLLNSAAAFTQQDNLEKAIEKAENDINEIEKVSAN